MRFSLFVLALVFSFASPLAAQQVAFAHASAIVPEVMVLEVEAHDAGWRRTERAGEAAGAVRLRVSANRGWKVMVSGSSEEVAPVWVRLGGSNGDLQGARSYVRVAGERVEVARGGPGGDMGITLDYRWAARGSSSLIPSVPVYTLVAD